MVERLTPKLGKEVTVSSLLPTDPRPSKIIYELVMIEFNGTHKIPDRLQLSIVKEKIL